MSGKKVNLEDIAKASGVSKATVSNALNDRDGVGKETKQKIKRIARKLGYDKKPLKKRVNTRNIRIVLYKRHGFVVSDTPFFSNLLEGIQRECRSKGYELLISHISRKEKGCKQVIDDIKNDDSLGYLILATEMFKEDLALFEGIEKPVVLLDSFFKHKDFDFVLINNYEASYKATCHLIQHGHRDIGYLHSSVDINNFQYRKAGFTAALENHDLKLERKLILDLEPTIDGSYRDMKEILEDGTAALPTAFFADNDIIAFGAMRALQENGVKMPDEVSIIGFDDMPYCEISNPKMSTVRVFKQYMGGLAVKRLIDKIENEDAVHQKIEVNTELIERDSVLSLHSDD